MPQIWVSSPTRAQVTWMSPDPENIATYNAFYGAEHPSVPGYRIPEMFAAAGRGDLKALWIMGEDLLQTDPNTCHVEELARRSLTSLWFRRFS
ncbi:MAG: hypothetical protein MZV63_52560 [Marinilabiliales bacterium]|nr:hypothetical protein [Marinilabiliales bacterium]